MFFPMLLPRKHDTVQRLIIQNHLALTYAGMHVLISKLRTTFWIFKSRATNYYQTCQLLKNSTAKLFIKQLIEIKIKINLSAIKNTMHAL